MIVRRIAQTEDAAGIILLDDRLGSFRRREQAEPGINLKIGNAGSRLTRGADFTNGVSWSGGLGLKMVEPTRWVETAAKALGVPLSIVDVAMKEARDLYQADLALAGPDRCLARQFNRGRNACSASGYRTHRR